MTTAVELPRSPRSTTLSTLDNRGFSLGLAEALTPSTIDPSPIFFRGFLTQPKIYAQCLLVLAEITRTRYYFPPQLKRRPGNSKDPVFTAHGDRLRAEVFSACNSVAARVDLHAEGVDGGDIGFGTTNVDLGEHIQDMLAGIRTNELLHFEAGREHIRASTLDHSETERLVVMPERWIRGFGNVAQIQQDFRHELTLDGPDARRFLTSLPRTKTESVWLRRSTRGTAVSRHPQPDTVRITGPSRLLPLLRVVSHIRRIRLYRNPGTDSGLSLQCFLPGIVVNLTLSEHPARGFSGEGSLLTAMIDEGVADDADLLASMLAFDPRIDVAQLANSSGLGKRRVSTALSFLAGSGRIGWDVAEDAYYHRELPYQSGQILDGHPRLTSARKLADAHAVTRDPSGTGAQVRSGTAIYRVNPAEQTCTCTWHIKTRGLRGPCKHLLAATLEEKCR